MAEQRVVLEAIARRTDLVAPDPASEPPRMRNVTMIPAAAGAWSASHTAIRISDPPRAHASV